MACGADAASFCTPCTSVWLHCRVDDGVSAGGALVTDAGSVLSHTAIVAREFALPAVVATANATSTLMDGEEVIVDGTRGVVTRC